jgi:hypothetical protein
MPISSSAKNSRCCCGDNHPCVFAVRAAGAGARFAVVLERRAGAFAARLGALALDARVFACVWRGVVFAS